jgi:hypothetical protein
MMRVDFFIKHICLTGMEAWKLVCEPRGSDSCAGWFAKNGLSDAEIDKCFANWAKIARLDINDPQNLPKFISIAQNHANDRAKYLGKKKFKYSTMLFLNDRLCKELSIQVSNRAAIRHRENEEKLRPDKRLQEFDYYPSEEIPLAITASHKGGKPQVLRNVTGVSVSIDFQGYCSHFGKLIGGTPV